jgi:hypothetical protein
MHSSKILRWALLAVLASLLAACGGGAINRSTTVVGEIPHQFDLVLKADKDGQFDLDGGTIAPDALRGHLRYRDEQHQTVHRILLKPGEKEKVSNSHLISLASIAKDMNIDTYVEDGGQVKALKMTDK